MATPRNAVLERQTHETRIAAQLTLDGKGLGEVETGVPFLDHMLVAFARHGGFDLRLTCRGDLHVDDHHTVEDVAIVLGRCAATALGEARGVQRFGHAYAPLDEALVRCVVDLSGRAFARIALPLRRERIGTLSTENVPHFFRTLATEARWTLHVDVLHGENDHHVVEAAFKALALALRRAVTLHPDNDDVPSTKGVLG